jgi:hypothetical protein
MAVVGVLWCEPNLAADFRHPVFKDPETLEKSKQYSQSVVIQQPLLKDLLNGLGLEYLHQLDPNSVYIINEKTKAISITDAQVSAAAGPSSFFGLGSVVANITSAGAGIQGLGKTVITCPFGSQTADVKGFMASTVSRDPIAGIRNGVIVVDDFLTTASEVNFSILKVPGGAKNAMNRTTMETTHTGSCGGELKVQNLVSTWPPLRIDLTVDDTGSMSNELAGAKAALTNFINTHNTDLDKVQRGVSYELISFKDAPTLQLANTEDSNAAISAVNSLFPSGGGDCPEDSIGAVNLALDRLTGDEDSAGAIVLITDASPHSGDISSVISRAQSLGVPVHVMLSGDCVTTAALSGTVTAAAAIPSARVVFEQLAKETGGLYFYRPGGTAQDYTEILGQIFETAVTGGDNEPPTVTLSVTPTTLWPPNHKMVRIDVNAAAVDNKDPNPVIKLVGVTSNESDNGQGDGNTEQDIQIDNGVIYLRAERSGTGTGRIYTITYQAMDQNGNVGFGSVDVLVPHNK